MRPEALIVIVATSTGFVTGSAHAEPSPWGADKALHLGLSLSLTVAGWGMSTELFQSTAARLSFAGGLALAAGGVKELIDLSGSGDADGLDFVMDLVGVGVGLLFALALDRLLRQRRAAISAGRGPP